MKKFEISEVRWAYRESGEITERRPPERIRVGLESAWVRCLACGHRWHAAAGRKPGDLDQDMAGVGIRCDNVECDAEEHVPYERFGA